MAHVLIVDDDADNCEALARVLARHGHATECAPNGREALAAVGARKPDAIVLDLRMPVMDGVTMLEVLRSYLGWQDLPVVVFSAYVSADVAARAKAAGVRHVFHKGTTDLAGVAAAVDLVTAPGAA